MYSKGASQWWATLIFVRYKIRVFTTRGTPGNTGNLLEIN